jgi:diguanylate cyclase
LLIQKGGIKPNLGAGAGNQLAQQKSANAIIKAGGNALDQFAREVLGRLEEEGLPPIPSYYELYFETMLQDKPFDFRKEVAEQLTSQDNGGDDKRALLETKLKEGFTSVKDILQNVSILYKQVLSVIDTTKKRSLEAKGINNPAAVQNFAVTLSGDAEMLANFLAKQAAIFKELYQKSANIVKEVETESIFDARYGIYNKRYLCNQVEHEQKMIGKYGHNSTLLLAGLWSVVEADIGTEKGVSLVNKTMAKLFMKTSRRSDVVAYFGQGIFALLLKHTDAKNSIRTSERLYDMMSSTNFFLGDKEIELKICAGIAELSKDKTADETIELALTALRTCDEKGDTPYVIAKAEK